jgi:acyl dehydratase
MHCQDAVGAEDILQEQQGEAGDQKPIHVSAQKAAELFGKAFARIRRSCFTLFR